MSYLRRQARHATCLYISQIFALGCQDDVQKFYLAVGLVASVGRINSGYLINRSRGSRRVVEYRRAAHYLAHVVYGLSLASIARFSGRHHTSVADSCRAMEERRDDPKFDKILYYAEVALIEIEESMRSDAFGLPPYNRRCPVLSSMAASGMPPISSPTPAAPRNTPRNTPRPVLQRRALSCVPALKLKKAELCK